MKKTITILFILLLIISFTACSGDQSADEEGKGSYGVFLSETEDLERLSDYDTIVIDAQYFTKEQISAFKSSGGSNAEKTVYTYINIGSLEDFRDYFNQYKDITLGPYENWDEEFWVDVSDEGWQEFMISEMIPALLEKDIDGFFVDNCDVYYEYPKPEILEGLAVIMRAFVNTGKAVIINSGDTFLDAYCEGSGNQWSDVITGINQETVFSSILWEEDEEGKDKFGTASEEDHEYFTDYIERYAAQGADIYLLEYTRDKNLIEQIEEYCKEKGFSYYISDSVELD